MHEKAVIPEVTQIQRFYYGNSTGWRYIQSVIMQVIDATRRLQGSS